MRQSYRPSASTGFLALSCVGFIASAGQAQTTPPDEAKATQLKGVVVTDTAIDEGGYKVDKADSPKFTAPLVDTPRSITVIPAQVLSDTASTTLAEALRLVPGITLGAGEGGNPLGDRPFIRGFDSQASTYLDGVRDIGAQSREIFAVEQIEVVKGSDSVMGGRGGAGGTLNLVSKMPKADRSVQVTGALGNADYKRATVDINQPLNDFVGIRLNAMWHDQDVAGRDAIFQKRWGVAPSIRLGLTGPTSLTASYYHLKTDELPDSGVPYLYTIANAPAGVTQTTAAQDYTTIGGARVSVPRGAFYGLKDRDFRNTKVDNLTLRAEHDFGNGITLRNTSRYGRSDQHYVWTQPDDSQGNVYGTSAAVPATAGGYVWRRINTRYGYASGMINQTDLYGTLDTFGIKHSFAASTEYSLEKTSFGTYVSDPVTGAVVATGSTITPRCTPAMIARYNCTTAGNPDPNDPWFAFASDTSTVAGAVVRSAAKTRTLSSASTKAASLFDTISIGDKLLVNLGGRYDRYGTSVSPGLVATAAPTATRTYYTRHDDLWTYQAGLVFKPAAKGSVYASTSTAATPPGSFLAQGQDGNALTTTSQSLTDTLKVEKTKSYEIGTKWNLFGEGLSLTLAAFHTDTRNARTTGENASVVFVGRRRIKGIEFGFNGNITPEWNVYGGYTYMDARIVDGGLTTTTVGTVTLFAPSVNTGKRFPNTPEHSFTGFTTYKILRSLSIGGGAIYMGKVYGGYSDLRTIANNAVAITKTLARYAPGYWRFDANAAWRINDRLSLQGNVNNLTNKRYYDRAYSTHYLSQAAGRTGIVTLAVKY